MSPLGLACTFEQMKRGKDMSILQVFEMETDLAISMFETREIYEGVRALLIDKDLKPNWKYKSVQDVPTEQLF